jgi:tRNA dimethylallyltransferase
MAEEGTRDVAPADAVLLLGPTACGKSALALALAQALPIEIVSVDSAQVYRGMDIGSAKPSLAERAAIPHHLIDIREPHEPYSAAEFVRDATRLIPEVRARGRLPLLVGGTMLYAKSLRDGLSRLPSADPLVRARLAHQAQLAGWQTLHARLAQVDPPTAARLSPQDAQRIQRALEVFELTGTPLSQLQDDPRPSELRLVTIALLPENRSLLHARIAQRFDAMLAAGFLDEVQALRMRADLNPDLPALRSVGYRQAWEHLASGTPFEAFRAAGIAATRQLAKRQITWLRSMTDATTVDPFAAGLEPRVRQLVAAHVRGAAG